MDACIFIYRLAIARIGPGPASVSIAAVPLFRQAICNATFRSAHRSSTVTTTSTTTGPTQDRQGMWSPAEHWGATIYEDPSVKKWVTPVCGVDPMSLFLAKDYWTARPDGAEECDTGCLCIANIDNDSRREEKIIVGTFQGMLRIYYPRPLRNDDDSSLSFANAAYQVEHLMLEQDLREPILQVAAGRFVPESSRLALAVLHPRRISVYNVTPVSNNGARSSGSAEAGYYLLNMVYEHRIPRSTYNFCFGSFGRQHNKDMICVQSMDGELFFFEQEQLAFSRYLNNFLVPGPLAYMPSIDAIVTATASLSVEAYKYSTLSSSSAGKSEDKDNAHNLTSQKRHHATWTINVGETVREIHVGRVLKAKALDLLVVGEQTVFVMTDNGSISYQRRVDYNPSCSCVFNSKGDQVHDGDTMHNVMVATHQNSLMVYKESKLLWTAKTNGVPVHLAVGMFHGIKGMVVTLFDNAEVRVSYMGTDPPENKVAANEKELDYETMDEEHRKLLRIIRHATSDSLAEPKDRLELWAELAAVGGAGTDQLGSEEFGDDRTDAYKANVREKRQDYFVSATIKLFIQYLGRDEVENISVNVMAPPAFLPDTSSFVIDSIKGSATHGGTGEKSVVCVPLRFRVSNQLVPSSLTVSVIAAYVTTKNEPRTAQCSFPLPMALACRAVPPAKESSFQCTVDSNRNPCPLVNVFPDLLDVAMAGNAEVKRTAAKVMTVRMHGDSESIATILVSSKGGRYRVQATTFEALSIITQELCDRLSRLFLDPANLDEQQLLQQGAAPFLLSFADAVPVDDFMVTVDKHFAERQKVEEMGTQLEKATHQFRVVQKRLLMRFKDKSPAPLGYLEDLMHDTYTYIISLSSNMEKTMVRVKLLANAVSCGMEVVLLLMRLRFNLSADAYAVLRAHLPPTVSETLEQGWEDTTLLSSTYLLQHVLVKLNGQETAAEGTFGALNTAGGPLKDTSKLRSNLKKINDRLAKGFKLVAPQAPPKPSRPSKISSSSNQNDLQVPPQQQQLGSSPQLPPS